MTREFAYPDDVPVLTDGTVTLRAHRDSDIPRIVSNCNDPRTLAWLSLPRPYDETCAREFLATIRQHWCSGKQQFWALDVDGEYAGTINLHHRSPAAGELGYNGHPSVRGRGVMTAAARLVTAYAFDVRHLSTVTWRAGRGNWASRRVAWAAGFTVDGVWPAQSTDGSGNTEDLWIGHLDASAPRGVPAHPWWEPTTLESNSIRLRAWRDDETLQATDDVAQHFVEEMQPAPETYADWLLQRRERMAAGSAVFWCIADSTSDQALGCIQLLHLDAMLTRGSGLLGYWLYPSARGRGVVGEAIELLRPHAFADRSDNSGSTGVGLHRLQAGTDVANRASARVLRRAGFRLAGEEQGVLTYGDRAPTGGRTWELLATDDAAEQRVSPAVVPVLETDRLRLRPWRESDLPGDEDRPDEAAERFMPAGAMPSPQTFGAWLTRQADRRDSGSAISWCIADRDDDRALGNIALFGIGQGTATSAEIGYWLYPSARHAGRLQEALEVAVNYAFSPASHGGAGLTRLHAATDLDNLASQAILRRAGFIRWGTDRRAYTTSSGEFSDGAYFEVLDDDDREAQRAVLPPVLDFPDIRLRPLRATDAERIRQTWADPISKHWLDLPAHPTQQEAAAYIGRKRYVDVPTHGVWWAICLPGSADFAGAVGLQNFTGSGPSTGELGYWLHPEARRRGLASAAAEAAATYGLMPRARGGLGLDRLVLHVADGNAASLRIAQRCGFSTIGRAHNAERLGDGSVVDLLLFERLPVSD
ncbi:GNAT family N-acetyltransferase [Rudaeicoccus suwonensis]|uniref:RimJ/RimL family protein N-acetyltransferase n=1 Tax=Rudaeicoccus suwonensis TaxID=657409 RepID=A0A561E996_9MICO|nr:GNAT family N-acetyltransferase [Rudaeicoccus suwonensis]TWE12157.1 RimJ/RimL family protein N-acetyltransferase [Rudaeicoccus suwonensis]